MCTSQIQFKKRALDEENFLYLFFLNHLHCWSIWKLVKNEIIYTLLYGLVTLNRSFTATVCCYSNADAVNSELPNTKAEQLHCDIFRISRQSKRFRKNKHIKKFYSKLVRVQFHFKKKANRPNDLILFAISQESNFSFVCHIAL